MANSRKIGKPVIFIPKILHSGPQGAELGHHEEVGLGLAEVGLIAFLKRI
jgi:hypothetical protein